MQHWELLCPGGLSFVCDDGLFQPSTDSFLLGSFPRLKPGLRVCDLGSGTGLLGLLLFQRQRALSVTGVELLPDAVRLAEQAAARNGLADRLIFRRGDLRKIRGLLPAGGFWLLQTLNSDYEAEFSIPVRMKDVPNNVVLTSEPPSELRVRVKDKGTVLLNYMLGKSFFPVNLGFLDYKGKDNHVKIYASDFEKKILSQLNVSSKILSIKPDTLEYIYSEGKSKLVPVRFQGKVTAGLQYYVSDTICNPDSVLVYAPEGILDTITTAYTQKINLENISDTTRRRIPLNSERGVKFVPASVEMIFPVDIYTEKTVEVPLHGVNFPADKALRTFPSKVQITFQVGLKRFRSIKASDFIINISYEELLKLGSDKYTVKLKSFPSGINQIRIVPEQVDFLIEQITSNVD